MWDGAEILVRCEKGEAITKRDNGHKGVNQIKLSALLAKMQSQTERFLGVGRIYSIIDKLLAQMFPLTQILLSAWNDRDSKQKFIQHRGSNGKNITSLTPAENQLAQRMPDSDKW